MNVHNLLVIRWRDGELLLLVCPVLVDCYGSRSVVVSVCDESAIESMKSSDFRRTNGAERVHNYERFVELA